MPTTTTMPTTTMPTTTASTPLSAGATSERTRSIRSRLLDSTTRRPRALPIRSGVAVAVAAVLAVALTPAAAHASPAPAPGSSCAVRSFPVPDEDAFGVTAGPGGTWFSGSASLNRVRDGRVEQFPVPDPDTAYVGWLAWTGRGPIWFADRGNGRVGTMTATGQVHEFQIPDGPDGAAVPQSIVFGAGGQVWFTDQENDRIGALDPTTGAFIFATVPTVGGFPVGMVIGHDGDLYFVERAVDKIGRLDPRTGLFTEWTLPAGAFPNRLAVDADGIVWFTELLTNQLGRIGLDGHLHELALPGGPVGITFNRGHLYVALFVRGALAQLSTSGRVQREWTMPMPATAGPLQIAVSHGYLWSTGNTDVYRVDLSCG